jgi:hypothetical protein
MFKVYGLLSHHNSRPQEQEEEQEQPTTKNKNKTKVVTADVADNPEPDNNIPIAAMESRVEEVRKRHDPLRGKLDKDDLKYISQGHTLVDLQEHFIDDHTTMSNTELEQERQHRNALRVRGKKLL